VTSKTFSIHDREQSLNALENDLFDLVIIGGGINGAGCAREACLRGMRVALIEANDFASGTSSRSSKLVHGGIRYLENYEFGLVFEALSERRILTEIAPHLVHPLKFLIPLYEGGRVSPNLMQLGMFAYDALALFDAPESHRRLSPEETCEFSPSLGNKNLLGGFTYFDAYMDDDRLVFETLRSAHQTSLLACANYVEATGVEKNRDGHVKTIRSKDKLTGRNFTIKGRHVISTVGPWTDDLGNTFFKDWQNKLRPTKGVHLTFQRSRFPLTSAIVMAAESRIVFAIPRHEMVIVGTTDTDYTKNPGQVRVEREDVSYLLSVIEKYFPDLKINEQDIVAGYAGVRPLVKDDASSEGKTSREHTIYTDDHHITYVIGGKYTTYRLMAEQTIHHALKHFSIEDRVRWGQSKSKQVLNELATEDVFSRQQELIGELANQTNLDAQSAEILFARHGKEALKICLEQNHLKTWIEIETYHAISQTLCLNLTDFYARRYPLILSLPDHGLSMLPQVLQVMKNYFGWSQTQCDQQVATLKSYLADELAWRQIS
jgi:glycerol-3-phosphate dehydrogenase